MSERRVSVQLLPEHTHDAALPLLRALSGVYSADFYPSEPAANRGSDAIILSDLNPDLQKSLAGRAISSLAFSGHRDCVPADGMVTFSDNLELPPCLRNQVMRDPSIRLFSPLQPEDGDEVVSTVGGRPFWVMRRTGKCVTHKVGVPIPELAQGDYIGRHLQPKQWAALLPLLHFVHGLVADIGWRGPGLRASFMFDDPNLHHSSYGHVNYRRLVKDALERNYHVSIATIPRDTWYVNPAAAQVFRQHPRQLSLLIHGNDHLDHEFGRKESSDYTLRSLSQALRRIEVLERRSGLSVSRVMAPPHGACAERAMEAMLALGYEAACVSKGSLASSARPKAAPATAGLGVATLVDGGFPVVHRFPFCPDAGTYARLAAFLGQPMIVVGHHDECAKGLEPLGALADAVNSFGETAWADMERIVRSNFLTRRDGEVLLLDMRARRITVEIPVGITHVCVIRNWVPDESTESLSLRRVGISYQGAQPSTSDFFPVGSGERMEVISTPGAQADYRTVKAPQWRLWPTVRRLLCECRDRVYPVLRAAS